MNGTRREVRGACALDCPDTCSWIVTVKGGEAVGLRGDPAHPYTRGSLCNKVADYLSYARAADRVLHPLRRVGPKGRGEFTDFLGKPHERPGHSAAAVLRPERVADQLL